MDSHTFWGLGQIWHPFPKAKSGNPLKISHPLPVRIFEQSLNMFPPSLLSFIIHILWQ